MTSHVITVCCAEAEGAPRQRDGLGAVGCSVAMGSRGRLSCLCNPRHCSAEASPSRLQLSWWTGLSPAEHHRAGQQACQLRRAAKVVRPPWVVPMWKVAGRLSTCR